MVNSLIDFLFDLPLSSALFHYLFVREVNDDTVTHSITKIMNENAVGTNQLGVVLALLSFLGLFPFREFLFAKDLVRVDV